MDDRASSIKVNSSDDIYFAGMSQGTPSGFSIVEIKDKSDISVQGLAETIFPNYLNQLTHVAGSTNHLANIDPTSGRHSVDDSNVKERTGIAMGCREI